MINRWDCLFLLIMTLPIMGHVVILPLLLDVAGRDGWVSAFLAMPVGFATAFAIFRVRRKHPGLDFRTIASTLAGKPVGLLLEFVLTGYFLFLSILSTASLTDLVRIGFLPSTPVWATGLFFLLFALYTASKGIKVIAWTATILGLIGMATGHSVSLLDSREKEFQSLFPVFEFGASPALWGTLALCSIWVELLFLLLVPLEDLRKKRTFTFWAVGVALNVLMMLSTTTGVIMIFGAGQADNFTFPAFEIVRILSLGFIDRFDIYALILMTFGCYIRTSLYMYLTYSTFSRLSRKKWVQRTIFWLLGVMIAVASTKLGKSHGHMLQASVYYIYGIFLLPIPVLLWLLTRFRRPA